MNYTKVESTMIDTVGYDEKTETLEVRFITKGEVYAYYKVSQEEYKALLNAPSKGTYMHEHIIDFYGYKKLQGLRKRYKVA